MGFVGETSVRLPSVSVFTVQAHNANKIEKSYYKISGPIWYLQMTFISRPTPYG